MSVQLKARYLAWHVLRWPSRHWNRYRAGQYAKALRERDLLFRSMCAARVPGAELLAARLDGEYQRAQDRVYRFTDRVTRHAR